MPVPAEALGYEPIAFGLSSKGKEGKMVDRRRAEALEQIKLCKIHLSPRLLQRSPRRIAEQFDSVWAPVEELARHLRAFPTALIRFLSLAPRGHIVLTSRSSGYEPGPQFIRGRELEAVASISLVDLVEEPLDALQVIGHLLDHLLGCCGNRRGGWLSDGCGLSPPWVGVGRQLPALYELGYAVDEVARAGLRQYFARSVAWYVHDRHQLNVADPPVERLLRRSLFDGSFCHRTLLPYLE